MDSTEKLKAVTSYRTPIIESIGLDRGTPNRINSSNVPFVSQNGDIRSSILDFFGMRPLKIYRSESRNRQSTTFQIFHNLLPFFHSTSFFVQSYGS